MFDGESFNPEKDRKRLLSQLDRVKSFMADKKWHTLGQIAQTLGYPDSSISARLRDLRKKKFGSHFVSKRRVKGGNGIYEYRVVFSEEN